jgi:hypothetical protein
MDAASRNVARPGRVARLGAGVQLSPRKLWNLRHEGITGSARVRQSARLRRSVRASADLRAKPAETAENETLEPDL